MLDADVAVQGVFVGAVVTYAVFVPYALRVLKPMFKDGEESEYMLYLVIVPVLTWSCIDFIPENRLPVGMVGSFFLPISLFWFGWTSAASIPWIVPIIGSSFFSVAVFSLFQAGLKYAPFHPLLATLVLTQRT